MKLLVFEGQTWQRFESMRILDKALHKKLCKVLQDMLRGDLTSGLEKTEPLKYSLEGFWSKSISSKDRLIYKFDDEYIFIFAIGGSDI